VQQCANCGWTDRTPDKICRPCGGARLLTPQRLVLAQLTKRYKVLLEIIAEENDERLRNAGGCMGARIKKSRPKRIADEPVSRILCGVATRMARCKPRQSFL
jgi:hypothetical protein